MHDEVIDREITRNLEDLPLEKDARHSAYHMGQAYLRGDVDWLLSALIDTTGFGADSKAALRLFHERLHKRKHRDRDQTYAPPNGPLKVELTRTGGASSSRFNEIVSTIVEGGDPLSKLLGPQRSQGK
jgi:hypothetical protein